MTRPRALAASGGCSHGTRTAERQSLPRAPKVSPRQRRRIEDTHAYLCARVDPIMGSLILVLMEGRPHDIRAAALDHLLSKKRAASGEAHISNGSPGEAVPGSGGAAIPTDTQYNKECNGVGGGPGAAEEAGVAQQQRLARRQDRLFMAREIGPLVTELIRRTLRCMPTDVEGFLIEQLQGCHFDGVSTQNKGGNNFHRQYLHHPDVADITESLDNRRGSRGDETIRRQSRTRPSTARSCLQQAQSLDKHVQQTSPPLSGRTAEARRSPSPPRTPNNGGLSDEDDDGVSDGGIGGAVPPSSQGDGGGTVSGDGVKESLNKPWDIEVLLAEEALLAVPCTTVNPAVDANIARK